MCIVCNSVVTLVISEWKSFSVQNKLFISKQICFNVLSFITLSSYKLLEFWCSLSLSLLILETMRFTNMLTFCKRVKAEKHLPFTFCYFFKVR